MNGDGDSYRLSSWRPNTYSFGINRMCVPHHVEILLIAFVVFILAHSARVKLRRQRRWYWSSK